MPHTAPTVPPGPNVVPGDQMAGQDLRAYHDEPQADRHAQALRLFEDPTAPGAVRCAVFTPGARLIVLQPGTGPTDTGPPAKEADSTGKVPVRPVAARPAMRTLPG